MPPKKRASESLEPTSPVRRSPRGHQQQQQQLAKSPSVKKRSSSQSSAKMKEQDSLPEISQEEAKLYDRQIRLWGLDAQARMRDSNVLLINVDALGTEILKNIVLAGIGNVTVLDNKVVTEKDVSTQFFVSAEDIGQNRAEAAIVNAQKLNPLVKISAVTSNITDTPDSFFESFHLIILSDATLSLMLRLDKLCGEKNIKFWATRVSGFNGFFFCDLISHEYTEQSQSPSGAVTKTEKHVDYVSLEHALSSKLSVKEGISIKKLKKLVSPLFFGFVGLLKFEMEAGVWPKEDEEGLKKVVYEVCEGYGVPKELVDDKLISALAKQAATEFTPVAAILGGIVAQEVLRTLSAKDAPSNNFFTIDVFSSEGSVMAVGVEPEAKKEDKGKQKEVMSMDTEEQDGVLILD